MLLLWLGRERENEVAIYVYEYVLMQMYYILPRWVERETGIELCFEGVCTSLGEFQRFRYSGRRSQGSLYQYFRYRWIHTALSVYIARTIEVSSLPLYLYSSLRTDILYTISIARIFVSI